MGADFGLVVDATRERKIIDFGLAGTRGQCLQPSPDTGDDAG